MELKTIQALAVDDSQFMRQLIIQYLMSFGISQTFQASNGQEALDSLKENQEISLVICDWSMPTLDGLTFVREVKKKKLKLFIILISSEKDPKIIQKFKSEGIEHFLIKPFTEDQFNDLLEKVLSQS